MTAAPDRLAPGRPYPLGATWDGLGVNFAVFSANAEKIDLCLFDPSGRREIARLALPDCTDEVWHGYLPEGHEGLLYGYRAHGAYDPPRGHRFNPNKLLVDPYARQLAGPLRWSDSLFGFRPQGGRRTDMSMDRRDSAAAVPKSVVRSADFTWGDDRRPNTPWPDTLIYETHVRGLSMLSEATRPRERGTFAALTDLAFIDRLLTLGVTAVELLPIHAFLQDRFIVEKGLRNYWGYSTLGFFAPEPMYLASGALNELRVAIRRLHSAGIEVILDVVYNHTCEGDENGPTLSWRGLDNASYYRLMPNDQRRYVNDTGTGNTLNLSHPRVLQMVMDSLRYWVESFHIDGFRFDLCSTLGRDGAGGYDPRAGFFDAILQDPVLSQVKLIAEPWDTGPGGYQLGNHPPGFAEWNDNYRDTVRRFWRGDDAMRGALASRLTGSADVFDRRRRRPTASVNYVTCHDGFTLTDLVSYRRKHNLANGENDRDGSDANWSAEWGVEGPTDDPAILQTRSRLKRAMLATLMVSQGTPMLLGGDEFGRSQGGNNNAYCQDNEVSWYDWALAGTGDGVDLTSFVAHLAAVRRSCPLLRLDRFMHGATELVPGLHDTDWFDHSGAPMSPSAWSAPEGRTLVFRRAAAGIDGHIEVVMVLMNADAEDRQFTLPEPRLDYRLLVDSADPHATGSRVEPSSVAVVSRSLQLLATSLPRS